MASPRKRKMAKRKQAPNMPQLLEGFVLTLTAEGKSPKTISFYEGLPCAEVAKIVGKGRATVQRQLNKLGVIRR